MTVDREQRIDVSGGACPRVCDRRQWLVSSARWAAFGSLAVLSVGLLARDHNYCSYGGPADCRNCSALPKCRLPQALETQKQNEKNRNNVEI